MPCNKSSKERTPIFLRWAIRHCGYSLFRERESESEFTGYAGGEFVMFAKSEQLLCKQVARNLRRDQTESEAALWQIVRNRKLKGKKFLRQHTIHINYYGQERFFVADFYCAEQKLVVELDGRIHERQQEHDQLRTFLINQLGFRVIRIKNEEFTEMEKVIIKIIDEFH